MGQRSNHPPLNLQLQGNPFAAVGDRLPGAATAKRRNGGGEPAAARLTKYLQPELITIYTTPEEQTRQEVFDLIIINRYD